MPDWREHIRQALTELAIDPAREEEVVAELVQHLDDRYRACLAAGGSDDEARRTALDELADARLLVAELMHAKKRQPPLVAIQDSRGGMLSGLWRDLRHGFRMIRRHPGFSSVAVLTLALGISANGAVFSVIHAVLLQELPYTRPGELVMVWESRPREGIDDNVVSPADFLDWRARQRVFASMAAAVPTTLTLSGSGEPEQLSASSVSAAFFSVLGVVPILGRDFTVEEEQAGRHRVVMLTHGLWQRRFAGTPDIVGTRITLSGEPYEVIGVLPASFRYGEQTVSVFSPIDFSTEDMRARFNHFLRVLARLKPGTTVAQAQENMDAISAQIQSEVELQNQGHGARVIALREQLVGDVRSSLLILMAAVAFVLLIACVNIANLLLARGASRAREVALRSALGAGRFLIARQVVMECLALATCSALVAVPVAAWSVGTLQSFVPADIPRLNDAGLNVPVIGFMVAIALLTGPVLQPRTGASDHPAQPQRRPQGRCSERRPVSPSSAPNARGDGDRAGLRAAGGRRPDDAESGQPARRRCRIRQRERADSTPRTSPIQLTRIDRGVLPRAARPAASPSRRRRGGVHDAHPDERRRFTKRTWRRRPRTRPARRAGSSALAHRDAWLFRRDAYSAGPGASPNRG